MSYKLRTNRTTMTTKMTLKSKINLNLKTNINTRYKSKQGGDKSGSKLRINYRKIMEKDD